MQVIARSSHAACQAFLTLRLVGSVAARRSVALRLVKRAWWTQSRSSGRPGLRASVPGSAAYPLAGATGETLTLERPIGPKDSASLPLISCLAALHCQYPHAR